MLNKDETPKWREIRDLLLKEIQRLDEASPVLLAKLNAQSDNAMQRSLLLGVVAVTLEHPSAALLLSRIAQQAARAVLRDGCGGSSARSLPMWHCCAIDCTKQSAWIQQSAHTLNDSMPDSSTASERPPGGDTTAITDACGRCSH